MICVSAEYQVRILKSCCMEEENFTFKKTYILFLKKYLKYCYNLKKYLKELPEYKFQAKFHQEKREDRKKP
jgi:hypothetical protein